MMSKPATPEFLWQACVPFVVKQMREKLLTSAGASKCPPRLGATATKMRRRPYRHDGGYRFVGDVVADENGGAP